MKLLDIARIAYETLQNTSKDLAEVVKIVTIVINALNQGGYIDTSRGLDECLEPDDQELANQIYDRVIAEST